MIIRQDCRFFKGDRPCKWHKETLIECDGCKKYDKIGKKILIIKQGEIGDVLRTTPLLYGLKEKYPDSYISWLVAEHCVDILKTNPLVDEVIVYNLRNVMRFLIEDYDIVINLDKEIASTSFTTLIKAREKYGFGFNRQGFVYPLNESSQYKYEIGLSDNLNRVNKKSYQEQAYEITGIWPKKDEYILEIPKKELRFAEEFKKSHNLTGKTIIGFNTGCGYKFQPRVWPKESYIALAKILEEKYPNVLILLFGGPYEKEKNKGMMQKVGKNVIDTGTNNTILEFCALVGLCDIFITGVTMGLHVAIALKKKLILFMGPLVPSEIDTYKLGPTLTPSIDDFPCLGCFKDECDKKPYCVESIKVETVFKEVEKHIALIKNKNNHIQ
jgi:ADP-heptose:LPS heptosyltransferase